MPLPPVSSGKVYETKVGEQCAEADRSFFHLAEIEADVGIEVEHQSVRIFELVDAAAPAVEFDRPHLHAGEDPARVLDIEIVLNLAVASP